MRQVLRETFWDPGAKLFADALVHDQRSTQFSEHANAMAMAMRIATPEQMAAIADRLCTRETGDFVRRASGIVLVTPAMSYFLLAGLCEAGHADDAWDLLQARFAHMVTAETNGTLWEEWWLNGTGRGGSFKTVSAGRSDAQTQSAFCPALFARYILGIEPTAPGLLNVVLRYYPSRRLLRRAGAIPTPTGLLAVSWTVSPCEYAIKLNTPPGMTLRVDLASLGKPARDRISLNEKTPLPAQMTGNFIVFPPGNSTLRVQRQ